MKLDSNLWWYGLRGCLYCGSLFPKADGLCKVCSEELWSWVPEDQLHVQNQTLAVASLFEWIPGEQQVLSRLLLALKGSQGKHLWNYYAQEFWRRYLASQDPVIQTTILVPSPAKDCRKDHALLFTEALANVCHGKVLPCLKRKKQVLAPQKRKSKEERSQLAFDWDENFSAANLQNDLRSKKVVFIDDIVTTGATAQAAWQKLGCPEDFTIWSLAQRSLSCGASMNLI